MRFPKIAGLVMAGTMAIIGTACSEDEVGSKADVVAMFEEQGLSAEMASCLADATVAEFGLDTMNERRDLTEEETTKVGEMTTDCIDEVGIDNVEADVEMDADAMEDACDAIPDEEAKQMCLEGVGDLEDMQDEMDEMDE